MNPKKIPQNISTTIHTALNTALREIDTSSTKKKHAEYMRTNYRPHHKQITCTLTEDEYQELKQYAKTQNSNPTTILRKTAQAYIHQTPIIPPETNKQLTNLIFLLRNISNNTNQIAHHTNKIQKITIFNILKINHILKKLENLIIAFVKNPKRFSK